jgi:hypothetical protein
MFWEICIHKSAACQDIDFFVETVLIGNADEFMVDFP